jgi:hypothetical protein
MFSQSLNAGLLLFATVNWLRIDRRRSKALRLFSKWRGIHFNGRWIFCGFRAFYGFRQEHQYDDAMACSCACFIPTPLEHVAQVALSFCTGVISYQSVIDGFIFPTAESLRAGVTHRGGIYK